MSVIVKVFCTAAGSPTPHDGRWIKSWNPHSEAGMLIAVSTHDRSQARRFADVGEVYREVMTVSRVQPVRPWDGEPNRPLRGLTIELEHV